MSGTKEFTATARIGKREAKNLIAYHREFAPIYQQAFRTLWHRVNKEDPAEIKKNRAKINTELQKKYGVSKRTANSLIGDALGRFEALAELKKRERNNLCWKIDANAEKNANDKKKLEKMKLLVAANQATERELARYRRLKKEVFNRAMQINRQNNRLKVLDKQIEKNQYSMCFGTKKFFKAQYHLEENGIQSHKDWLEMFRKKRDSGLYYLGSAEETASNLEFQLSPIDGKEGWFNVKIRASNASSLGKSGEKYVTGKVHFSQKDYAEYLADNLDRNRPLQPRELCNLEPLEWEKEAQENCEKRVSVSYRMFSRGRKFYLAASFRYSLRSKGSDYVTDSKNGVVGLDFNSGHIQLSETNESGNLVRLQKYPLHRQGTKMETDLREAVAHIIKDCAASGKPLAIESLDFSKKKSKTKPARSDAGKDYNRMIHRLNYSDFTEAAENSAYRNRVELIKVNPAYTTKIAKQKYCSQRKLVIHEGAAFVIARRAQGFKDEYIDNKNPKKNVA